MKLREAKLDADSTLYPFRFEKISVIESRTE